MSIDSMVWDARALIRKGLVLAIDDTGQRQRATVQTEDGNVHAGVEVFSIAGFASVAEGDGAECILVQIGGDAANMVALPLGNPAARLGGGAPGDRAIFAADGTRVAVRVGGIVQILAATSVEISAPTITVTATTELNVTGPVTLTGSVAITGDVTITGTLDVHGAINDTSGTVGVV